MTQVTTKTIKQIADEIGVSRQAVHQKIKKEPLSTALQGYLSTVDGALQVETNGERLIKAAFISTPSTALDSMSNTETLIDMLKLDLEAKDRQLVVKDIQIEAKDFQLAGMQRTIDAQAENIKGLTETITMQAGTIKDLSSSLYAAQALHAGTIQKQLTVQEAAAAIETPDADGGPPPRRRWWQFWKAGVPGSGI